MLRIDIIDPFQLDAIINNQTRLTTVVELPGMDESMDKTFRISELEKAGQIRQQLIESER
jgi:hypothetical protein